MDSHQRKTLETAANEAVKRALQMQPGNGGESREKPPQPTAFHKRHEVELGIEFCLELLVVFYQLGRELMGLPVNVPLGAGCWAVAMLIAIRIFWIVPFTQTLPLCLKATTGALIFSIAVQVSWHTVNEAYRQQIAGEQMTPDTKLLLGAIKA